MLKLIRYLKGYLCIKISGYSPERFMNLCRNNGIVLWDITPMKDVYLLKMSVSDYRSIKPFSKKTRVKAAILQKNGLPFFMFKNKKRKVFFWGIPICIISLYLLTFFLWAFQFNGNRQVTDDMLFHFFEKQDIRIGTYLNAIPIEELEKKLREEYSCITWVSIKIEGTQFIVDINENDLIEENLDAGMNGNGTNIIAMQDGTIMSIVTRKGIPKVKKNDIVKKGDVLVDGNVPIYNNDNVVIAYEVCDSDADITIKYTYPIKKSISRYYQYKNYTGRVKSKHYFKVWSKYFSFQMSKIPYLNYDILQEEHQWKLLKSIYLPIYTGKNVYQEYVSIDALYSEEKAEEILLKSLSKEIEELSEKGVQIIENNVKIEKNNNSLNLNGGLVVLGPNDKKETVDEIKIENTENIPLNE